jgi:ABC-type microcin C transport system duplicated ATPase subunit YejF
MTADPLLSVSALAVAFRHCGRETLAVNGVSYEVGNGQTNQYVAKAWHGLTIMIAFFAWIN